MLAALMALPALTALLNGDPGLAWTFAAAAVLSAFFGVGVALATRRSRLRFEKREGFLFVILIWITLALFGALPLHFAGFPGGGVNAFFEAISGLTTTGATVFEELEAVPPAILLWRALLQWAGGLLTVVLAVCCFPTSGPAAWNCFKVPCRAARGRDCPRGCCKRRRTCSGSTCC